MKGLTYAIVPFALILKATNTNLQFLVLVHFFIHRLQQKCRGYFLSGLLLEGYF